MYTAAARRPGIKTDGIRRRQETPIDGGLKTQNAVNSQVLNQWESLRIRVDGSWLGGGTLLAGWAHGYGILDTDIHGRRTAARGKGG